MGSQNFALIRDGQTVATFPTKEQCAAEAFDRKWVVLCRGRKRLVDGVAIEPVTHWMPLPLPPADAGKEGV